MTAAHKEHRKTKKSEPEKKPESIVPPEPELKIASDIVQPQKPQPASAEEAIKEIPAIPQPVTPPAEPIAPPPAPIAPIAPAVEQRPASLDPLTDFKEKMSNEERISPSASSRKNYMWPIIFIFFIVILLLVGVFLYRNGWNIKSDKINIATPAPTSAVAPEPTKKTIDLAKYEIEILNGTGISGEASRQKANLEEEGFTVSSIGNADNSDYTKTIIKTKKEIDEDFVTELKNVLENSFTVGETESLSEDASVPIVIILGAKK